MDRHNLKSHGFIDIIIYLGKFMFRTTTKLVSDNTGAFLQISKLHYQMGDLEDGLR